MPAPIFCFLSQNSQFPAWLYSLCIFLALMMKSFDTLIDELELTFRIAPEPDHGFSMEIDDEMVDISWGWSDANLQAMQKPTPLASGQYWSVRANST